MLLVRECRSDGVELFNVDNGIKYEFYPQDCDGQGRLIIRHIASRYYIGSIARQIYSHIVSSNEVIDYVREE